MRSRAAIVVGMLLALCCVASAIGGMLYLRWPRATTKPVVLISSPRQGEEVRVGEAVRIHAIARDGGRVARVEFWADGELWTAQNSSLPGGTSPFPLVTVWHPMSPGNHTIIVRAFNTEDARSYASISLNAVAVSDADDDGVSDESDACPDQAGLGTSAGCADADGDGVSDADDACPDEVGVTEAQGCPAVTETDRDGDGIVDGDDACPDDSGSALVDGCPDADGDGTPDAEDACPAEPGLAGQDGCAPPADADGDGVSDELDDCAQQPGGSELQGCPDLDADGIADREDDCPDEVGSPEQGGCPDADEDGVRDQDDLRPEEPGGTEDRGAPDTGAGDSDGDGLSDDVDRCDSEEGDPEHDGCPPPGHGADSDGDGIADEDEAPEGPTALIPAFPLGPQLAVVEVEGLEFLLGQQYDEVTCYIGVGDYYEQYGPYELEGGTRWDIATDVGGENSVVVEVPGDERLEVFLECEAYVGDEPPLNLGTYRQEHDSEEWIGTRLGGRSEREEEPFGATFLVYYRICEGSCEECSLPAPLARLEHTWINEELVDTQIVWSWAGDEEAIHHFGIYYMCGDRAGALLHATPQQRRISVHWIDPHCNETCEFHVAGYRMGGLMLTPRSNRVVWNGGECARGRSVTVEFVRFWPSESVDGRGPIYGDFWANDEFLSFDGAGEAYCGFYDYECGYYIEGHWTTEPARMYAMGRTVGEMFRDIVGQRSACGSCSYSAPSTVFASVAVPEGQSLTLGLEVWEYHHEGADVRLCRAESTIQYDELEDDYYYVFPPFEVGATCRLQVTLSVWDWIGG